MTASEQCLESARSVVSDARSPLSFSGDKHRDAPESESQPSVSIFTSYSIHPHISRSIHLVLIFHPTSHNPPISTSLTSSSLTLILSIILPPHPPLSSTSVGTISSTHSTRFILRSPCHCLSSLFNNTGVQPVGLGPWSSNSSLASWSKIRTAIRSPRVASPSITLLSQPRC